MKRIATVAAAPVAILVGMLGVTPALAHGGSKTPPTHVHYCNCGDAIGKAMCGSSTSSSSTSSGSTTSSTSGGATTSSTSGGSTTSSTSGGATTSSTSGGTAVPEPGMLGIMGLGFIGMAAARRRRR